MQISTRTDYSSTGITANSLGADPIEVFGQWFREACNSETEPEAACLSTVSAAGVPSGRIILLKAYGEDGFTFYTNYESRKASELSQNANAALTLYWPNCRRSVRIIGKTSKTSRENSRQYFRTRPLASRLGAHASPQSRPIPSREYLLERVGQVRRRERNTDDEQVNEYSSAKGNSGNDYDDDKEKDNGDEEDGGAKVCLEPPLHWGGYRLCPVEMEFWAGRPSRLHDRIVYRRECVGGQWTCERLGP